MKNVFLSLWQLGIIKKYAIGKEGISMSRTELETNNIVW